MNTFIIVALIVIGALILFSKSHSENQRRLREQFHIREDNPTDEDIRRVLKAGQKIYAIKLYRTKYGCGLKEAKEAVEKISIK